MNKPHSDKQVVYGIHAVEEALLSGRGFERIYITKDINNDAIKNLYKNIKFRKLPHHVVPSHKLNRLTRKPHQGVVAYMEIVPNVVVSEVISSVFEEGRDPRILILDGITDVRNFGALSRSAVAFGFDAIVVPNKGSALIHEDAIKTSAGALFNIHVCRVKGIVNLLKDLADSGLQIVACTEKKTNMKQIEQVEGPFALVMGSESTGIQDSVLHQCDFVFNIPISDKIDSLNVSVAGAIAMHNFNK